MNGKKAKEIRKIAKVINSNKTSSYQDTFFTKRVLTMTGIQEYQVYTRRLMPDCQRFVQKKIKKYFKQTGDLAPV